MGSSMYIPAAMVTRMAKSIINLENTNIKISLHSENPGDIDGEQVWGDMINEIAGGGYTGGGKAVTGLALSNTAYDTKWDAHDIVWTSLTNTFQFAVVYIDETVDGVVQPIIAKIALDENSSGVAQDVTVVGVDYTIVWSASGIISFDG